MPIFLNLKGKKAVVIGGGRAAARRVERLIDARRGIAMFRQVHAPILGLLENMSHFPYPHCIGRSEIFAHGGARAESRKFGAPCLSESPLDMANRETSDARLPNMAQRPDSQQAAPYLVLAERIRDALRQETQ